MDATETILRYLGIATRMGKSFARKHQRYEPECVAEAWFILTQLVLVESKLLAKAVDEEVFIKIVIARRLGNYFRNRSYSEEVGVTTDEGQIVGSTKEDPSDEIGLIDELDALFPGERDLIALWREGFNLDDLIFLDKRRRRRVEDLLKTKRKLARTRKAALARKLKYGPVEEFTFSVIRPDGRSVSEDTEVATAAG
jgi:hypothetical protein